MKIHTSFVPLTLSILAPVCAFAHDTGAKHEDAPFARSHIVQPPAEMLEVLRDGKGVPSADSDAVKALMDRYLSRRSNRGVKQPLMSADVDKLAQTGVSAPQPSWQFVTTPFHMADAWMGDGVVLTSFQPPAGNGLLMAASFAPFKPKVRFNWDPSTFFIESDNMPEGMPNRMVGIATWQQLPIPRHRP